MENKVPNGSGLVKETDFNTKVREVQNKIPNIRELVITSAINTEGIEIENKIFNVTRFFNTTTFNTLALISLYVRLKKQVQLIIQLVRLFYRMLTETRKEQSN